jgi:hypothetical protein
MGDENGRFDFTGIEPQAPKNLRVAQEPYPHLRDDDGCVLARDYISLPKMAWILARTEGEGL